MDNQQINRCLLEGNLIKGVLPHLEGLSEMAFVFEQDFGLPELPLEPGIIWIRGPRQYGKSTWLEQQIALTIKTFGAGSAFYLNGDEIKDSETLISEIRTLLSLFPSNQPVKRLFIDEITAIVDWQKAIKRLADKGELKTVLLITTGSKASDLRRGTERLPGRKGRLSRHNYIFTPISYKTFKDRCESTFKEDTLFAYLLSGGSSVAANALAATGKIPEYVVSVMHDWILGEFSAAGRSRAHLLAVFESLFRMACTPVGQSKLARESGFSNNTVAQGYIELLSDLMIVVPSFSYDFDKKIPVFRKPCKYHFVNLLVAICFHPKKPRTIEELKQLGKNGADLGVILEWAVAQEVWRKMCIKDPLALPDFMYFWQSKNHEIDFVLPDEALFIEVKSGKCSLMEFAWFLKTIHKGDLWVVNQNRFESARIKGLFLEEYLL